MAKTSNNKNLIIGICAAVVAVIVIVVAIILGIRGGGLNDSYFVSDGAKLVISLDDSYSEEDEYSPRKIHEVYTYSGENITGQKTYYVYDNPEEAKAALDYYIANQMGEYYKDISQDGKYVIFVAKEANYEGMTVSDVKQQIEWLEILNNMDTDDEDEDETIIEETNDGEEIVEEIIEE